MKTSRLVAVPLLVSILLFSLTANAAAATCTRLANDFTLFNWNDVSKWDCGFVPGPTDIAVIPGQVDFFDPIANIALNEDITLAGFVMAGGRIEGAYTITVTDEMLWSGGDLHYTNTAPFVSPSVVVIAPGANLTVQIDAVTMSSRGKIINEGTTLWKTGVYTSSPPTLDGASGMFINNGTFRATASAATWNSTFENNGTIRIEPDGLAPVKIGTITNQGALAVKNGALSADLEQITGTTTLDRGMLQTQTFNPILLKGGRITGSGIIDNELINSGGVLAPIGVLRIDGFSPNNVLYTQGISGTLEMSIGGIVRGAQYSSLTINGGADMNGTLDVNFTGGFTPDPDDGFIIAACVNTCEGEFATNTSVLTINYGASLYSLGAEVELHAPLLLPQILKIEEFQR